MSQENINSPAFLLHQGITDSLNIGILVINRARKIIIWNKFMETYSKVKAKDILGKDLYESFPELPKPWVERKLKSVFLLKSHSFTSWQQRPYLFRFPHNRPITGDVDFMYQDCAFVPINLKEEEVACVCIAIFDVTDVYIYQSKLDEASETMETLEKLSQRDGLTGVYNRRHVEKELGAKFKEAREGGKDLSMMIIDLDHFKNINDTRGHLAGDEVLRKLGHLLLSDMRKEDIVGRYGGEEFIVVMPNTQMGSALGIAEKLRKAIENMPVVYENEPIPITASIGLSQFRPEMLDYKEIIKESDDGLYKAKEGGRNCVVCP